MENNLKIKKQALAEEISIEWIDESGRTLIHLGVSNNDSEFLLWLLNHSSNPNITDNEGIPPLKRQFICTTTKQLNFYIRIK